MSSFRIFNIAGSALAAQNQRLNTVASNLANANSVAGSADQAYRARQPVFQPTPVADGGTGVRVSEVRQSTEPAQRLYQPGHPLADDQGYVWAANVNVVEEMANMISAAQSYRSSLELMNTAKTLMMRALNTGR